MRGRSRRYVSGRERRAAPRFTAEEYADLAAAAQLAGLTTTGFVAEAALAAARGAVTNGMPTIEGISRSELARLQRELFSTRTAVNQTAATVRVTSAGPALDAALAACVQSVAALDTVISGIHQELRRTANTARSGSAG